MKLNNIEIDKLDRIIASDTKENFVKRQNQFSSLIATAVIMYGGAKVAYMLRETANMVESQDDGLHEAYKMRCELFKDLRQL